MIGFALASPGEAEQFLLRVGKAAFASDLVQPGRQLSVMRAVQLPPIGVIIAHRNSAVDSDEDERCCHDRYDQPQCAPVLFAFAAGQAAP